MYALSVASTKAAFPVSIFQLELLPSGKYPEKNITDNNITLLKYVISYQ
jgi:hypothetical protein